ncbi:hypothetical protein KFU94_06465 [Chloroflexi bacterium TSY]|nr:hypothetical protein [Chloroflexi bacterium TSY]
MRAPDDAGSYTNKGTGRLLETGQFPYGDPILRGGSAATYGPVLYAAHIPFQLALSNVDASASFNENPISYWIAKGRLKGYDGPPILATKLTVIFFHLFGIAALILIGRWLSNITVGLGLACLFAGSAYVQGIGGETHFTTGLTFISHIALAALTMWAFLNIRRPLLSGVLLALGAGALFYPIFFVPLWFGYYFWRGRTWRDWQEWGRFVAGFAGTCLAIFLVVLLMTQAAEGETAFQAIYDSTVGHQEARDTYGASTFSFWGTHPSLAAFWQEPFIDGWHLLRPSFTFFLIFLGMTFFMARGRTLSQLAFLTAAVALSIQLWKSHAGGTYVEWYYPFFLIGLYARPWSQVEEEVEESYPQQVVQTRPIPGYAVSSINAE